MKEIPLTKGFVAIVDDEDFEWVSQTSWIYAGNGRGTHYAGRWVSKDGKRKFLRLHREVIVKAFGDAGQFEVDHINRNGLDNRRENLRMASRKENLMNRSDYRTNKSGVKGVYWVPHCRKWEASLTVDGAKQYYGLFSNKDDAANEIKRHRSA
jgi:hypothetical protein